MGIFGNEKDFENAIERSFISPEGGYEKGSRLYDKKLALYVDSLINFIKDSQENSWNRYLGKCKTQEPIMEFCSEFSRQIEKKGVLEVLRNGFKVSKAVTKGLEPNRKMKDSGIEWIGDIPENWEVRKLKNLFQFLGGYAFKSDDYVSETDYQIIRMGNVKDFKILFDCSPAYISEDLALSVNNYKLKPDWILFTMTGTRGKKDYFYTCKISEEDCNYKNLYLNQRVGCLIPNENIFSSYFNYLLKVDLIKETVFLLETGTNLSSKLLQKKKVKSNRQGNPACYTSKYICKIVIFSIKNL